MTADSTSVTDKRSVALAHCSVDRRSLVTRGRFIARNSTVSVLPASADAGAGIDYAMDSDCHSLESVQKDVGQGSQWPSGYC